MQWSKIEEVKLLANNSNYYQMTYALHSRNWSVVFVFAGKYLVFIGEGGFCGTTLQDNKN
jgi:hypothetical protein